MMFLLLIKCLKNICEIIHLLFKLKRKIKMSKKKQKLGLFFSLTKKLLEPPFPLSGTNKSSKTSYVTTPNSAPVSNI